MTTSRRRALAGLAALWLLFSLLAAGSEAARRTRSGEWLRYWRKAKLTDMKPAGGFAYVASLGRTDLSSREGASPARVLENGVEWSAGDDPLAEIRGIGHGRYLFWKDAVYFSASDNSNPRTNGRVYKIHYPALGARAARTVYGVTALALAVAALATAAAVRSGLLAPYRALPVRLFHKYGVRFPIAWGASSLVVMAVIRAGYGRSPAVEVAWVAVIGLNLAVAWALRRRHGKTILQRVGIAFLLAVAAGYAILTTLVPLRHQTCLAAESCSAWDVFCLAPDSASYYVGYTPGSTRNPVYPLFIRVLTWGAGFDPPRYTATHGETLLPIADEGDPLFRVARVQIVLLLSASLVACASMMRLLGSPLPALMFLWLYDHSFFTTAELNVILTEALVQAWLFLLVAVFLAFLRSPRTWLLLAAALLCGLLYLTRQAAGYSVVFLVSMALWVLARDFGRWWCRVALALGLAVCLCAIPDLYAFLKLGGLTRQQEQLQYQYRIGHAMQYALAEDVAVMPDEESRRWLEQAVRLRDREHETVDQTYSSEYVRMVHYIGVNLYSVATPPGSQVTPQFLLGVANPILARHWREYLGFGLRFWQLGLSHPGLARISPGGLSPWLVYAVLGLLALWLRDRHAMATGTLVAGHWLHVAIASFFAAPLGRMVWASEILVVLGAGLVFHGAAEKMSGLLLRAASRPGGEGS